MRELMPHQQRALTYCHEVSHPALFMEMRLGKTLVAIRYLLQKSCERILVVAPLTVLGSWHDELDAEDQPVALVREGTQLGPVAWYLCNYEHLRARPQLAYGAWDAVVLDESTRIRNPKTQTTRVCCRGFRDVPIRMVLSGLPCPEDEMDFFGQFVFLRGSMRGFDNFYKFRYAYFKLDGFDWIPKPGERARLKEWVHREAFVLLRKEAGLGSKKIYERRYVQPTAEQKSLTRDAKKNYAIGDVETKWAMVLENFLSRIAGGYWQGRCVSKAKADELVGLLEGDLKGQRVVVFFRYTAEVEGVYDRLRAEGYPTRCLVGATPPETRHGVLRWFRATPGAVLLVQIKLGKYGLDLSAASTAVYYSNSYSQEERGQSEDRLEHPSKKDVNLYIDLITKGTVDEIVVDVLRDKSVDSRYFLRKVVSEFKRRGL